MTPLEVITVARNEYNAANDTFWSDAELYDYLWWAHQELAREALLIEATATDTTVADQETYDIPTRWISFKRIEYNNTKLRPSTFRELDSLKFNDTTSLQTGTPRYWAWFDDKIYLFPIPTEAQTLEFFYYAEPAEITVSSTLEIPSMFHMHSANFILMKMSAKDKNYQGAAYYERKWELAKRDAKRWQKKRSRQDGPVRVQDVDTLPETILGAS